MLYDILQPSLLDGAFQMVGGRSVILLLALQIAEAIEYVTPIDSFVSKAQWRSTWATAI